MMKIKQLISEIVLNFKIRIPYKIFCLIACTIVTNGSSEARQFSLVELDTTEIDSSLLEALLDRNFESFNEYLSLGADPTKLLNDSYHGWAFCAATEKGREPFLESIIKYGFDVNFAQSNVSTEISRLLNCAVTFNNLEALIILISADADPTLSGTCPECSGASRLSALGEAVMIRQYKLATWLLDKGDYSEEQLDFVVRNLEMFVVDESAPINKDRLELVEALRNKGIEVHPWTREGKDQ